LQQVDNQRVAKSLIFALFPAKKSLVGFEAKEMLNRSVKKWRLSSILTKEVIV